MKEQCPSPSMLTDLYQLTMAQAYLRAGKATTEGCFHLYFRTNPFGGGYAVAAGLEQVVEHLSNFGFTDEDIAYLAAQTGADGRALFTREFLAWLRDVRFTGEVDAVPEGTVVFAREPLLRVCGPLPVCQIVETALLNIINFQTLVATKASRCCLAAAGDQVIEFGLRRAQGPDGGLSASRAAFIGGCVGTSNVLAGQRLGIPVAGTHAHSWVMAFDTEIEAFEAYADALPNNVSLLVDTYDTLEGVRNAVAVGRRLAHRGQKLLGVRIDSGDLAWLSRKARAILDEGGLTETKIIASNELDEHLILSLKDQGAAIDVWGVGTKLVTAWDQPALGGVYKLSAIRSPGEEWSPRVKVSEQTAKVTTPGVLGLRRYMHGDGSWAGDMIYDTLNPPQGETVMVHPEDPLRSTLYSENAEAHELLVPVFRDGRTVYELPNIDGIRAHAARELEAMDASHKRFLNPHTYKVGLEEGLSRRRLELIAGVRVAEKE